MSIFGVNAGEASSFTQQYLQLIEAWLHELLDRQNQEKLLSEPKDKQVEITIGDQLVYGMQSGKKIANITPEIIDYLEQIHNMTVGDIATVGEDLTLKVDGEVLLQSDVSGRVLVNSFLPESSLESQPNQLEVEEKSQQVSGTSHNEKNINIVKREFSQQVTQSNSGVNNEQPLEEYNSTIDQVRDSLLFLQQGNQGELVAYLKEQINEIQKLYKAQLADNQREYEQLIQERLKEQTNPNWWQQSKNWLQNTFTEFKNIYRIHETASALKQVFAENAVPGSNIYYSENYTITRSGKSYTLSDVTGKSLMQFQDKPLGVSVDRKSIQLDFIAQKDLEILVQQYKNRQKISVEFSPIGQHESNTLERVQKITKVLSGYAKRQGKTVSIDGQFSYKWKAAPDGRVLISAKDGRGTILAVGNGLQQSRMSERDLAYFEQILPRLEGAVSFNQSIQLQSLGDKFQQQPHSSVFQNQKSSQLEPE